MSDLGKCDLGTIVKVRKDEWEDFKKGERQYVADLEKEGVAKPIRSWDRAFLNKMDVTFGLYKAEFMHGLVVDGDLVAVHAVRVGKKSHGQGGRFLTSNFVYTPWDLRHQGYGSALLMWIEEWAKSVGMKRLKTRVGSYGGFRMHWRLGHEMWAHEYDKLNKKSYILINTPLVGWTLPRDGIYYDEQEKILPRWVSYANKNGSAASSGRLRVDELMNILTDPTGIFKVPVEEIDELMGIDGWYGRAHLLGGDAA